MRIVLLFPLLALALSALALQQPELFAPQKSLIVPLLMMVMLLMGISLSWRDFAQTWQLKRVVMIGVGLQFLLMPLLAFVLSHGFALSTELLIGMVLVGATAGGTASNVIAYLARGHLALSVSMTLTSTLLSVLLMPFLVQLYLGHSIDIPVSSMLLSLLQIVLAPILIGMLLRHWFGQVLDNFSEVFSLIAMLAIVMIIAIVVALNADRMAQLTGALVIAVMLHNLLALLLSYALIRRLAYDTVIARTVAIEVAMQNSGLSVALALKYFGTMSALPGALFSIWHNLSGAAFAAFWQWDHKNRERKQ